MSYNGPKIRKLGKDLFINIADLQVMLQAVSDMRFEEMEKFVEENYDILEDAAIDSIVAELDGAIDEIQRISGMITMAESQYKLNKVNTPADLEEIFPKISSENT